MTRGLEPLYAWRGVFGGSLSGLVGAERVTLDPEGVRAAFGEVEAGPRTCLAGATKSDLTPPRHGGRRRPLRAALEEACARIPGAQVAVALSGGVDSAVLAALLGRRAVAYTLATLPGYGEEEVAHEVARRLGIALRPVAAGEDAIVDAVPDAVRAAECPLYNLHPVTRLLLARAVRADGFDTIVTGDGADQIHRGSSGADYLPVVGALGRAAGLATVAPFLDPQVVASVPRDPGKGALRALALDLGVPARVATAPKRARLAPPMSVERHLDAPRVTALARALERRPSLETDRERVAWTTLALLARAFPGLEA